MNPKLACPLALLAAFVLSTIQLPAAEPPAPTAPAAIARTIDAAHHAGPFPDLVAGRNTSIQKAPAPALALRSEQEFGKARITKCWLNLDEMWDYRTRKYDYNYRIGVHKYDDVAEKHGETWDGVAQTNVPFEDYLNAFGAHSDEVMLTIRRYERDILDGKLGVTRDDWKTIFKNAVMHYKGVCPNLRYIEVCNEYALKGFIGCNADEYYGFYRLAYQAVNEANAELKLAGHDRLLVGGPVVTGGIIKKLDLFFANFAADPSPDKRLDFVSWHEYHNRYAETAHREAEVKAMLRRHGLQSDLPFFITEHDPYHPRAGAREYNLINAAGLVKSLYFTSRFSPGIRIMPWVQYHVAEIQTRFMWFDGPNEPDTRPEELHMLPAGCSMKLLSMHKKWELPVENSLEADQIVLASVQEDGLLVQAVNYGPPRDVRLQVDNLARAFTALGGGKVRVVKYLIDEKHSNRVTNPDYPGGLETVEDTSVTPEGGSLTLVHQQLPTNGIVAWQLIPAKAGLPTVRSSARDIPISAKVDLLVIGGNEAGLAAAWTAAKAGAEVMVVNGNYFFSDDVAAKARYWIEADETPHGQFAERLFGPVSGKQTQLVPAQYKRRIDDLLLEAGVRFQFNSKPAGLLVDAEGNVAGVLTANKAGLQAVVAKVVIDTTPMATVARMAGAAMTPWSVDHVTVSRVCYGVDVPKARKIGDFREYSVDAPMATGSWPERCKAEVLLREKFNRVDAKRAHAQCLHVIEPACIVAESGDPVAEWSGGERLDPACCRPKGVPHVYVVGQGSAVSREIAEKLTRPVHLANLGEQIGKAVVEDAKKRPMPAAVAVKPVASQSYVEGLDVSDLLTGARAYERASLGTVQQPDTAVPVWGKYDVIVVGGGTSGIPAAIGAARNGAKVLVIEMLGQIGGNRELGTAGYWKGYPYGFNQWKWRAAEAFQECRKLGVDVWYNTLACGAVKQQDRVCGVALATPLGRGAVLGRVVIDATGDADVCAAAGAKFAYLNDGDLCLEEASFRAVGLYANVLPLDHADEHSLTMHHVLARKAGKQEVWDFYPMVGLRETRLIQGDYVINVLDQIIGRTYKDLICVSWSAYDPHGYHTSDYIYAGLMPLTKHETKPGFATYIPYRALLPKGLDGILNVGRSHSVTHDVQSSVRMNPDLINEGYAAGYTAAEAIKSGTTLRDVDLGPIQDHLAEIGNISASDRAERCVDTPEPTDAELKAALADLKSKLNLATVLRAGKRSLPMLVASFQAEPTLERAKALCVLGDRTAVPYLVQWLDARRLGQGTAYQWDAFLSVPDVEGVMWLLGTAGDDRAVPALVRKLQECGTDAGSFSHIRAVTTGLGRIGSPAAAPALYEFLNREGIRGHVDKAGNPDSVKAQQYVKSYVELFAAGALVRCGDHEGLGRKILTDYLDDWRGIFVRYAGYILERHPKSSS